MCFFARKSLLLFFPLIIDLTYNKHANRGGKTRNIRNITLCDRAKICIVILLVTLFMVSVGKF